MKPPSTPSDHPGIRFDESTPLPPPPIPDHELIRCVGRGSYGEVWLARNVMGSFRAVKIIYRHSFRDDHPFEREYAGLKRFEPVSRSHDSQVDILHMGRSDDWFYYVMELADDEITGPEIDPDNYRPHTLRAAHEGHIHYTAEETLEIGLALTTALENLHKHGLIHRDIKPSNVIFVNGIPKLADIGLVSSVDATRSFVGTEGFVPPEGPGATSGDLYSLGKVLYELCTGRDRKDYPELPTAIAELPDREQLLELNAIIAKACRESPKDRYQTATAMRQDLLLMQSGKSVRRMQKLEQRLVQVRRLGIAATVIVLLATSAYLFQRKQTEEAKRLADENRSLADEKTHLAEQSQISAKESNDNVVRLLVANGNSFVDEGNPARSLPWLAAALKRIAGDKERENMHRIRLDSIVRQLPRIVQIFKHDAGLWWCEFSPDGTLIATASKDHTARVWDVVSGRPITPPLKHEDEVRSVVFSPDSTMVATTSLDKTARVWDASDGEPITMPLRHEGEVKSAAFSPDGKVVLTTCKNGPARLWDSQTGEQFDQRFGQGDEVNSACFSPNGKFVMTGDARGQVTMWERASGTPAFEPLQLDFAVNVVAFSNDGSRFTTGTDTHQSGVAQVWSAKSGRPLSPEMRLPGAVTHGRFSPDGRKILTGASDSIARIWDSETGTQIGDDMNQLSGMWSAVFSPDGSRVATCSDNDAVHIWDSDLGTLVCSPLVHAAWVRHATFSPDGYSLATASEDGLARIWNLVLENGPKTILSDWPEGGPADATFGPEGKTVLAAFTRGGGGNARLWDLASGTNRIADIRQPDGFVGLVAISNDGEKLLLAPADAPGTNVTVWSTESGEHLFTVGHSDQVTYAMFSPDGHSLLTTSTDKTARVWDAKTGQPNGPVLEHSARVNYGSFSPDGAKVVTASWDHTAQVWDWVTGRKILPPLIHDQEMDFAGFSPDGNRIVTTGKDQKIRIWDATTGRQINTALDHPGRVRGGSFRPDSAAFISWSLAPWACVWDINTGKRMLPPLNHRDAILNAEFSGDGKFILTSSLDKTARLWDGTTGEMLAVPFLHGGEVRRASFHPHQRSILTASSDGAALIWDFKSLDWPVEDIISFVDLMSAHEIDDTLSPTRVSTERIVTAFERLQESRSNDISLASETRIAWHRFEAAKAELSRRWSSAVWHLGGLIKDGLDTELYERRGDAEAELGWWEDAKDDYVRAGVNGEDDLVLVNAKLGDVSGSRRFVAQQVSAAIEDRNLRSPSIQYATLVPDLLDDYSTIVRFAEEDYHSDTNSVWAALDLAFIYYRAGRSEDAFLLLQSPVLSSFLDLKSQRSRGYPIPLYRASLILAANNERNKAEAYLGEAMRGERRMKDGGQKIPWTFFCHCDLLRDEAESLIQQHESEPAVVASEPGPEESH